MLIKSVWILAQVFVARTLSVQSQIIGQCVPVILVIMENLILNAEEQLVSFYYNEMLLFLFSSRLMVICNQIIF